MKRSGLWFTVVLILVFVGVTGVAWAQEGTASSAGKLTRGEFAALLVEAGGLDCGAVSPAELLVQKGIMLGYPDGELYLDRQITWAEGATLAAKTLGLREGLSLFPAAGFSLDKAEYPAWSYDFAAWVRRFGLLTEKPDGTIGKAEGKAFLEKIFSTDPAAVKILEEAEAAFKEIETLRTVVNGQMKMIPRPGVEGAGEIAGMALDMRICQEMVLPDKMHQKSTVAVVLPGEVPEEMEITTEMYIIGGKIYLQMPDPETGTVKWFTFPEELFPNMEQMFRVENQTAIVPPELENLLSYQLLGSRKINGEEVYEVAFYGCIDDLGKFMEAAFNLLGDSQQLQQLVAQSVAAVDTMSIWGVQYVDRHSYATKEVDLALILTFTEEMFGQPNPIQALQMFLKVEEYDVNAAVSIELPEEAAAAPLLELPAF